MTAGACVSVGVDSRAEHQGERHQRTIVRSSTVYCTICYYISHTSHPATCISLHYIHNVTFIDAVDKVSIYRLTVGLRVRLSRQQNEITDGF